MNPTEYADMTLEELVEIQQELTATYDKARSEYKAQIAALKPYLEVAWAEHTAKEAAKAPPDLDQRIG